MSETKWYVINQVKNIVLFSGDLKSAEIARGKATQTGQPNCNMICLLADCDPSNTSHIYSAEQNTKKGGGEMSEIKNVIFHMRPVRRSDHFEFSQIMDVIHNSGDISKNEMELINKFWNEFKCRKLTSNNYDHANEAISENLEVYILVNEVGERTHLKFCRRETNDAII